MGTFPTSHLLMCPAKGARLSPWDLDMIRTLFDGCESRREYIAHHWRCTNDGAIEAQVQFKGGPHEALEWLWRAQAGRIRCIWARDSDDSRGLDWIYRIDDQSLAEDIFYNPCDRRAMYAFDELRVALDSTSGYGLAAPWVEENGELVLRGIGAYFADNRRSLHDMDGPFLMTPTTPETGDGQPNLMIETVQGAASVVMRQLDQYAVRVDALYRGRRVRHCTKNNGDTWPIWRMYSLDHWDNCVDQQFLLDQKRDQELLPDAFYALPHPPL